MQELETALQIGEVASKELKKRNEMFVSLETNLNEARKQAAASKSAQEDLQKDLVAKVTDSVDSSLSS